MTAGSGILLPRHNDLKLVFDVAKILNPLYGTKRADANASEFYVINITEGTEVMCQIADGRAVNATQQIHKPRPAMSAATAASAPVTPPRADTPPEQKKAKLQDLKMIRRGNTFLY